MFSAGGSGGEKRRHCHIELKLLACGWEKSSVPIGELYADLLVRFEFLQWPFERLILTNRCRKDLVA